MSGAHRGVVVARGGMVAASQPLAVSAGLHVLQAGGNFVDAAIATSAVLCVVEPYASQLGGDAFAIVYESKSGSTMALNGSGAAPQAASAGAFPDGIPVRGLAAASIPGLVDAWFELHKRWGTWPVRDLLAPAIDYAEAGFPAGYRYARRFAESVNLSPAFAPTARTLLGGDSLPEPGSPVRQPDLAWTLKEIAAGGRDGFYQGPVTERIVRFSQSNGGLFSSQDFASHASEVREPIRTTYRGRTIHGQPPVSQGIILLQELGMLEGFDMASMAPNTAATIHLQVEAKRLAFADRARWLGDPAFVDVPIDRLLSIDYLARLRRQINPLRAEYLPTAGATEHDTTYFCAADGAGNAISFIQSVFWSFGCGVVADGTGVLFNNRMRGFSRGPAGPNLLQPGKRPVHTLNAWIVTDETKSPGSGGQSAPARILAFVGGTPGGDVQVQTSMQVLCNLLDFGMNPQEAVEAPRWQHGPSVQAPGEPEAETLDVENRIPDSTSARLRQLGHRVERIGAWEQGGACQVIARDPGTGTLLAGSDPRCDGHAAGF